MLDNIFITGNTTETSSTKGSGARKYVSAESNLCIPSFNSVTSFAIPNRKDKIITKNTTVSIKKTKQPMYCAGEASMINSFSTIGINIPTKELNTTKTFFDRTSIIINHEPFKIIEENSFKKVINGEKQVKTITNMAIAFSNVKADVVVNGNASTTHSISVNRVEEGYQNMEVVITNVTGSTETAPGTGGSSTGNAIKNLTFTVQQMSFFEFIFKFADEIVEDVIGLPEGMYYMKERQMILGAPKLSGRYSCTVSFQKGNSIECLINVPKIRREL